jgi:uncharacterized protein (TIGR03435 family)
MYGRLKHRPWLLTIIVATASIAVRGQAEIQNAKPQVFEVAVVKENRSGSRQASMQLNIPDAFSATNQTLQSLMSLAYDIPAFRMKGGPDWFRSARFDVNAKADHRITNDEKRDMVRSLLEQEFKLRSHRETADGRFFALVIGRSDRKLGPNLKPTSANCAAILDARAKGVIGASALIKRDLSGPTCGSIMGSHRVLANGVAMAAFANILSVMMREVVTDETGLDGLWDLDVSMNFLESSSAGLGPSTDAPSMFTSLQEQLGLKLERRRGVVETFVIDSAEKPHDD